MFNNSNQQLLPRDLVVLDTLFGRVPRLREPGDSAVGRVRCTREPLRARVLKLRAQATNSQPRKCEVEQILLVSRCLDLAYTVSSGSGKEATTSTVQSRQNDLVVKAVLEGAATRLRGTDELEWGAQELAGSKWRPSSRSPEPRWFCENLMRPHLLAINPPSRELSLFQVNKEGSKAASRRFHNPLLSQHPSIFTDAPTILLMLLYQYCQRRKQQP